MCKKFLFIDKDEPHFFVGHFSAFAFGKTGVEMQRADLNSAKLLNVVSDGGKHSFDLMVLAFADAYSSCRKSVFCKGFYLCRQTFRTVVKRDSCFELCDILVIKRKR